MVGRKMAVKIISWLIPRKVWDQAEIELTTTGSAVRHISAARHVTNCTAWPRRDVLWLIVHWLFLVAPWVGLQCMIVAFPDHTYFSDSLTLCMLSNFSNFCCRLWIFKFTFSKKISGTLSECQTIWTQIRTDILSALILVRTVCKGYQQKRSHP